MENRIAGRFFRIVVCSSMLFFSAFAFGQKLNAPGNSQLSPEINVDTIPAKLKRNSSNTLAADPNGWSGFYIGKNGFYILPFYQNERGIFFEVGFRKEKSLPDNKSLDWEQSIAAVYSITNNSLGAVYKARFNHVIGNWNLLLNGSFDQKLKNYFWGLGNETPYTHTVEYYRLYTQEGRASIGLNKMFSQYNSFTVSGFYESIKVKRDENHFAFETIPLADASVFNTKNFIGAEANYSYYKVNDPLVPTKGFGGSLNVSYTKNLSQTSRSFEKYWSALGFYIPIGNTFSFASKNGVATLGGEPEFYQYKWIGGGPNLKGFHRDRFYGKTSFYNDNELRWIHNMQTTTLTSKIGLIAFIDDGRVWMPNEISNKWHVGYGGGLLLVPLNKIAVSVYYGVSDDDKLFAVRLGRFF
jgi:outer membrane translocation and assembly module TamA